MAIVASDELQLPPVIFDEKVVVNPEHTFCVPLNIAAVGAAVTIALRVEDTFAQPPVPVMV